MIHPRHWSLLLSFAGKHSPRSQSAALLLDLVRRAVEVAYIALASCDSVHNHITCHHEGST